MFNCFLNNQFEGQENTRSFQEEFINNLDKFEYGSTKFFHSQKADDNDKLKAPIGVVYSPYFSDGRCKTPDDITMDLYLIKSKGFKLIRVYDVDCYFFSTILPVSKNLNIKIAQGLRIQNNVNDVNGSLDEIISYSKINGWDIFEFFIVGNEVVFENKVSSNDLLQKISEIREIFKINGYDRAFTTAEPAVIYKFNNDLCHSNVLDFIGINSHPYFNPSISHLEAGSFVRNEIIEIESICGKKARVLESGYPSQGNHNGLNVPSFDHQKIAIKSIIENTDSDVILLSTFDDFWKVQNNFNIEHHFGVIQHF